MIKCPRPPALHAFPRAEPPALPSLCLFSPAHLHHVFGYREPTHWPPGCTEGPQQGARLNPSCPASSNSAACLLPCPILRTTEPKREDGRIQQDKGGARRGQWSQNQRLPVAVHSLAPAPGSPMSSGSFFRLCPFQLDKVEVGGVNGGQSMDTGEEGGITHQLCARYLVVPTYI